MSNIEEGAEFEDKGFQPDEVVSQKQLMKRFNLALSSLPNEQRDVFLLREEAGLTSAQIADVLQVSIDTVKSRMRYAVSRLKEIID